MRIKGSFGELEVDTAVVDRGNGGYHEYVAGRTSYALNGEPIDEDEARRLIDQWNRERQAEKAQ